MHPTNEAGAATVTAPTPRHLLRRDCNPPPSALCRIAGPYLAAIADRHGFGPLYLRRLLEAADMLRATEGKAGPRQLAAQAYSALAAKTRAEAQRLAHFRQLLTANRGPSARPDHLTMQHHSTPSGGPSPLRSLLTYKQAAELLGVCSATVYNLVRRGELPASKLGSSPNSPVRIDPADLAAYITASKAGAGGEAR